MAKTVYYRLELFLKHLHKGLLNLLYNRNVSNKIDNNKDWVGIKTQSSYFNPLFPKKAIGTDRIDNAVTLYMELQNTGKSWKRL